MTSSDGYTANALTKQQTLDPVGVGCPLTDQSIPFPVTAAKILFLDARDHHHGADMTLTTVPGNQSMKDVLHIDTVGLHPPRPPVDPQAGRFHHLTRDTSLFKEPHQPKTVITGLVAQHYRRRLPGSLGHPIPCRIELRHQPLGIATQERMQARIVTAWNLDRQQPAVLAQL
ncbi:MAG: hypothetical protein VB959_16815, partial [Rhodospirillales bacterium]